MAPRPVPRCAHLAPDAVVEPCGGQALGLLMEVANHPTGPEALRLSALLDVLIQAQHSARRAPSPLKPSRQS
eukprot:1452521-Prymnesium_polylepis.1